MIDAKSECDGSVAMRRFLLVAAIVGTATAAQAADMPDFLRGSFTAPVARTNWQGVYVGGLYIGAAITVLDVVIALAWAWVICPTVTDGMAFTPRT